jgi:trk system potassium uptake protein TrkA
VTTDIANEHTRSDVDASRPHVVIVGCGRVGAGLAERLVDRDHSVSVIDMRPSAFRRVDGLDVTCVDGVGYDRETLRRAGIKRAVALAAVSNGDNSNIVVARTAREAFGVERVFARIHDLRRAAVYERLGIPTVASAQLTIDMSMRRLLPAVDAVQWTDPSATVSLLEAAATRSAIGRSVSALESDGLVRVAAVCRLGRGIVPTSELVIQEGDLVYLAVSGERIGELAEYWSNSSPGGGAS